MNTRVVISIVSLDRFSRSFLFYRFRSSARAVESTGLFKHEHGYTDTRAPPDGTEKISKRSSAATSARMSAVLRRNRTRATTHAVGREIHTHAFMTRLPLVGLVASLSVPEAPICFSMKRMCAKKKCSAENTIPELTLSGRPAGLHAAANDRPTQMLGVCVRGNMNEDNQDTTHRYSSRGPRRRRRRAGSYRSSRGTCLPRWRSRRAPRLYYFAGRGSKHLA